jgi:hypothetical protein
MTQSQIPGLQVLVLVGVLGACGTLAACGSAGGTAGSQAPDDGGLALDSGVRADDGGGTSDSDVSADAALPDVGSPEASSGGRDGEGLLPRCTYSDASSAIQCPTGLTCIQNGSCDPPAAPNCGEVCIDCSNPPPGLAGNPCAQQCSPPCPGSEVCVGSQTFAGYAGDGGTCPAGTNLSGSYCESPPTFACAPTPTACGAMLGCGCAGTLCTGSEKCGTFTARQVNCVGSP